VFDAEKRSEARLNNPRQSDWVLSNSTKTGTGPYESGPLTSAGALYRSDNGPEPVREWLKGLEADERKVLGEDIQEVEFSWPIGMPLVGSLGRELWESGVACRAAEWRGLFSAWNRVAWCGSTASSKDPDDSTTRD
jgi:hypothetical protein